MVGIVRGGVLAAIRCSSNKDESPDQQLKLRTVMARRGGGVGDNQAGAET